jgi:hypothetical protein
MRPLLLAFGLLTSACSIHKSELDETLEWMDNTYNAHESVSGAYGHGRMAWYAPAKGPNGERTEVMAAGMTESFTYRGCEMFLKTEDDKAGNEAAEIYHTAKFIFNLRDIDPSSTKISVRSHLGDFACEDYTEEQRNAAGINCDHAELDFKTRNEAGLIAEEWHSVFVKLTGANHENNKTDKTNGAYFVFNDPEYAKRFGKAFTHAVELCGGKPSPF